MVAIVAFLAAVIGVGLVLAGPLILLLGVFAVGPDAGVAATMRTYVFVRLFSAPFALLNYAVLGTVLGCGRGSLGLMLQLVINGVNIALSILFGLVLGGGVAGVALGAEAGEAAGAAVGLAVVLRGFAPAGRPSRARVLDRTGFRRMLAVNRDIMIRSLSLLTAYLLFTRLGAGIGAPTLAANGILLNMFMIGSYFLDGVATAAEQIVGRAVGARWRPAFDAAVRWTVVWSLVLSGGLTLLCLAGASSFVAFLTTDGAIRAAAAPFGPWAAFAPLAGALAFLMDGIYIGATWSRTMRDMMLASLVVFVAAALVLTPALGNHGLWLSLLLFLSLRGATLSAALPAMRRRTFGA